MIKFEIGELKDIGNLGWVYVQGYIHSMEEIVCFSSQSEKSVVLWCVCVVGGREWKRRESLRYVEGG
jgi:hypothetical protein